MLQIRARGFKSLLGLNLRLERVTVLIGPPASGKSNILEAIGLVGYLLRLGIETRAGLWPSEERVGSLSGYLRLYACTDLLSHYGPVDASRVSIESEEYSVEVTASCVSPLELRADVAIRSKNVTVRYSAEAVVGRTGRLEPREGVKLPEPLRQLYSLLMLAALEERPSVRVSEFSLEGRGVIVVPSPRLYGFDRMGVLHRIAGGETGERMPPYPAEDARNLGWALYTSRDLLQRVRSIVESIAGIDVRVLSDGRILFFDGMVDVPPGSVSDTVARIVYAVAALLAAKRLKRRLGDIEAVLEPIVMLEEPEAHLYPIAYRYLADLIREAARNAYIIVTTHSGRLAELLWEKTDARIYYVTRGDGGTRAIEVDMDALIRSLHDVDDLIYLGEEVLESSVG